MNLIQKKRCKRQVGIVGCLLALCLLAACGGTATTQVDAPIKKQFLRQIEISCAQAVRFSKTVLDLQTPEAEAETKQYDTMPQIRVGTASDGSDSLACQLMRELEYVLSLYHDDPFLKEYYTLSRKGDTLQADLGPDSQDESALQWQQIVGGGPDQPIRYIRSKIHRANWLYTMSVDIQVEFDTLGLYQTHLLEVMHDVSFIDQGFQSEIRAKATYHD